MQRPLKHHVLEEVSEPCSPRHFVLRAYVIPDVDGHYGRRVIFMKYHAKAVVQSELCEFYLGQHV